MKSPVSQFTFPLRALAQVPVFGAFLHCIGKAPSRSSLLAFANIIMLLIIAVLMGGAQGLLWCAAAFGLFIVMLVAAVIWEALFGKTLNAGFTYM